MTTQFKPGDRVRCIDANGISLALGMSYEVRTATHDTIVLVGYESHGHYSAKRFDIEQHSINADVGANKYARRIRSIPLIVTDVYEILDAYDVRCPAVQHAIKKLLMAGQRGVKSRLQDLNEAKAAIERAIEMEERR